MHPTKSSLDLYRIYAATLFFALHTAIVIYIHSTYLETMVSGTVVGILYTISAIIGTMFLSRMPHVLRLLGNKKAMVILALVEMCSLAMMAFGGRVLVILLFFIIHHAIMPMLYVSFDVFVEHFATKQSMGQARGTFLSIISGAFIVSPMLAGFLLSRGSFQGLYLVSVLLMVPLVIFIASTKTFKDPHYHDIDLLSSVAESHKSKNIFSIINVQFILQMFYATMVVYMPLVLHDRIGFGWDEIGLIFTIMLVPFLIFELPLGRLSDRVLGEKELLIAGLCIMVFFTGIIPFISSRSVVVWAILLFMTRVGASFVEIMAESYFFKKVKNREANILSLWRNLEHGAYIITPIIISTALFFIGTEHMQFVFLLIASIIAVFGLSHAFRIKDTL